MSLDGDASKVLLESQKAHTRAEEEFLKTQARKLYEGLSKVHSLYRGKEPRLAVWLWSVGQSHSAIQMLQTDEVLAVIEETAKHVRSNGTSKLIAALNTLFADARMSVESNQTLTKFTLNFHPHSASK